MTPSDLYFQSNEQGRRVSLEEMLASTDLDWLENLELEINERLVLVAEQRRSVAVQETLRKASKA